MTEQPHILIVSGDFDPEEPIESFELKHHPDCPTKTFTFGSNSYIDYVCDVGEWDHGYGLGYFFCHASDPADSGRESLAPGTHLIEVWTEGRRNCLGVYEFDGGLRVVSESQAGAA